MSHLTPPEASHTPSQPRDNDLSEVLLFALAYETDSGASDAADDVSEAGSGYDTDLTEPDEWHPWGVGYNADPVPDDDDGSEDDGVDLYDPVEIFSDSLAAFNFDSDFPLYHDIFWDLQLLLTYRTEFMWDDSLVSGQLDVEWALREVQMENQIMEEYEESVAQLDAIASRAYAAGNHELITYMESVHQDPLLDSDRRIAEVRGRISGLNEYIADLQQGTRPVADRLHDYRKQLHWAANKQ